MVGGGKGSFIGPIHRMAIRMDDLADLVDGCYSHTDDWRALIERCKGKIDFLAVCTPNSSHYEITKAALEAGMDRGGDGRPLRKAPLAYARRGNGT